MLLPIKEVTRLKAQHAQEVEPLKRKVRQHQAQARRVLHEAIARGEVIRQACSVCRTTVRVHGHHFDYHQPLVVVWLCHRCHKAEHAKHWAGEGPWAHVGADFASWMNERGYYRSEEHPHERWYRKETYNE